MRCHATCKGLTKGSNNAPFRIYQESAAFANLGPRPARHLRHTIDPITQEVVTNSTFKFGDQLMRHVTIGTALSAGEPWKFGLVSITAIRRTELMATDRINGNGFSFGNQFQFENSACATACGFTTRLTTLKSASIRGKALIIGLLALNCIPDGTA